MSTQSKETIYRVCLPNSEYSTGSAAANQARWLKPLLFTPCFPILSPQHRAHPKSNWKANHKLRQTRRDITQLKRKSRKPVKRSPDPDCCLYRIRPPDTQGLKQASRIAKVSQNRPGVHHWRIKLRIGGAPISQNIGYEPLRQTPGSCFDRGVINIGAKQLMSETDRATNPVRFTLIRTQTTLPVE